MLEPLLALNVHGEPELHLLKLLRLLPMPIRIEGGSDTRGEHQNGR